MKEPIKFRVYSLAGYFAVRPGEWSACGRPSSFAALPLIDRRHHVARRMVVKLARQNKKTIVKYVPSDGFSEATARTEYTMEKRDLALLRLLIIDPDIFIDLYNPPAEVE
jgi:hypothetical protein